MSVSTFRIDSPDLARYFFPPYKGGRRPRWPDGPRPFSRALIAHTAKLGNLRAVQDQSAEAETVRRPVAPVALWDPDSSRWPLLRWTAGGRLFRPVLATSDDDDVPVAGPDEFVGELAGDVLAAWRLGAPSGTAAAGNLPARLAKELLVHRPADVLDGIALIGKEGAQLLERQQDLVVDPAAWLTVYGTSATELCGLPLSLVRTAVDAIGPQVTADMSGLAKRSLYYLLRGRSSAKAEALVATVVAHALSDLRHLDVGIGEEETPSTLVARWLTEVQARQARCAWAGCTEAAKGKGEHCERHRRAVAEQQRRDRRAAGESADDGGGGDRVRNGGAAPMAFTKGLNHEVPLAGEMAASE